MKKLILVLLTVLMLFSLFKRALKEDNVKGDTQPISNGIELFYTVTIEQDKEYVGVEIDVKGLSQTSFNIGFYEATADIHNYVSNLIVDAGGIKINLSYFSVNTWSIQLQNAASSLKIYYEISKVVPLNNIFWGMATGKERTVIIVNDGGILAGQNFFIVPLGIDAEKILVKFNLPQGWKTVCPYIDCGDYFEVPRITKDLIGNFVKRKGIYFGRMKFYSEEKTGNCTVKFGVLEADKSWSTEIYLRTQEEVDFHVYRTALAIEKFTQVFGENPYPVEVIYTNFATKDKEGNDLVFAGTGVVGAIQYWPKDRYDELTGHLLYNWFMFENKDESPICSLSLLAKGLGETYLGCLTAYELTSNKTYLGKFYYNYLVYKRALNTKYMSAEEIRNRYYRGGVIGLYLDNLIRIETNNSKSIYDVFSYLYKKFKHTEHCINNQDLEEAINAITGKNHNVIFSKYVYGDEEIPVKDLIQPYREAFNDFINITDSDFFKDYHDYVIPFFIDVEISIPIYCNNPTSHHLPFEILCNSHYIDFFKYVLKNYEVSSLTEKDVEDVLGKLTGEDCSGFFERWNNIYGDVNLDSMKQWLKSYFPYSPKNLQVTFRNNAVTLKWDQVEWRYVNGYYGITGYAIYRGTSAGNESLIGQVDANTTIFTDNGIEIGKTYYYYVKSINNFYLEIPLFSDPSEEVTIICRDIIPPEISILQPIDNSILETDYVSVSGKAIDSQSGIDKVTVEGNEVSISPDGLFSVNVPLVEGVNRITIIVTDKAGNQATKTVNVTYKKVFNVYAFSFSGG
ncbi:MAG: hypothetical protein QXE05_12320, partial [Nitrososphaeria archaeon]